MRGRHDPQPKLFYSIDVEAKVRPDHPLRPLKRTVDEVLAGLSERFAAAYGTTGRPSVPPERLLKALLLMALYSVRSERQLVERFFNRIKHFRGIATRYDRRPDNFLAAVKLAAIRIWIAAK